MNRNQRAWTKVLAATLAMAPLTGLAQTTAGEGETPAKLPEIEVTGSYIPVAADSIAIPVAIVDTAAIERTGVLTNALEVLKKSVPQFTGNANIGANNANISSGSTGGGSQASLRNLTTLTLINGRRVAVSPITGQGGNQFVDLSLIPLAAIAQIEILLDGASATYGSDATSGVINIKTKRNYQGGEITGFYEWSDNDGNWENRGGNFVFGASNGKTSVVVAGGWSKQDPLFQFERSFSNPSYGTPTYGGVFNLGGNYFVLNPALSAPPVGATKPTIAFPMTSVPTAPGGAPYFGTVGSNAVYWGKTNASGAIIGFGGGELAFATSPEAEQVAFNLSQYVTLLQRREARGLLVSADHVLSDSMTFFSDVLISTTKTQSQINGQPLGTGVSASYAGNPFNNSVTVRNRSLENPRVYKYDTNFVRVVGGIRGEINDRISYETAINLNQSDLAHKNPGVIDFAGFQAGTGISPADPTPTINLFQRDVSPEAWAAGNFIGTAFNDFTSRLESWDGRLLIDAFELSSGFIKAAVGGEYTRERLTGTADINSIPDANGIIKWTGATSVNPFSADRDITSAWVEIFVPITSAEQDIKGFYKTEVTLSGRYEKYSDTDDPTVPKISFRWLPFNDEFAVRGSYGESFNAPTLYQLFGPSDVGFTPSVVLLPFGLDPDNADNYVGGQANLRGGSNPALSPAESKSYNLGVVWSPKSVKGLVVEATYWKVEEENIVGVISSQSILQDVEDNGPNSQYIRNLPNGQPNPNYVGDRNNPVSYDVTLQGFGSLGTPVTAPGQVANNFDDVYVQRPLVNIATQEASGVDASVKYKYDWTDIGLFEASVVMTYWIDYVFGSEDLAGYATITGGTIPRWSTYTQIGYTRGNINAYFGHRFIPTTFGPDEAAVQADKTSAEHYSTYDFGVAYEFDDSLVPVLDGLRLSVSVQNLGNELPPTLPNTFTNSNADDGTYSPIGRSFTVAASYKF